MQSSAPWSDVINYLAIDPWVSGILGGPPSHIHQAWSLQPSPSGKASDALSSPQHSVLLGYNTDLLFFCFFVFLFTWRAGWTWRTVLCTEMFWHIGPHQFSDFDIVWMIFTAQRKNRVAFRTKHIYFPRLRLEADKAWVRPSDGPGMKRRQARRASRQMVMIFIIGSLRKVDARVWRCKQRRRRSCKGEASLAQSQNNQKKKNKKQRLEIFCVLFVPLQRKEALWIIPGPQRKQRETHTKVERK